MPEHVGTERMRKAEMYIDLLAERDSLLTRVSELEATRDKLDRQLEAQHEKARTAAAQVASVTVLRDVLVNQAILESQERARGLAALERMSAEFHKVSVIAQTARAAKGDRGSGAHHALGTIEAIARSVLSSRETP